MAFATWLRALSAVGTVADATRLFRGGAAQDPAPPVVDEGGLETRLANVVVAALREAFDRDRARFDLERELHEAEQARRAEALRLEWLRQTATHMLTEARQVAMLALGVWVTSAAAAAWLTPFSPLARGLLGGGWAALALAIASALVVHQQVTGWLLIHARETPSPAPEAPASLLPESPARRASPALFVAGFLLTAIALVLAL